MCATTIGEDIQEFKKAGRISGRVTETWDTKVVKAMKAMDDVDQRYATEQDRLRFELNGQELPADRMRRIAHTYMLDAPRFRTHSSYWYIFRLEREHWPVRGDNTLVVTLQERDPETTPSQYVRDVELEVKYLRGKSHYRGRLYTDPDLGPHVG